jgi:hypothetical protein
MKKVYVTVLCEYQESGYVKPLMITWPDGRKFEIDKILDVRKAASHNVGGQGYRFTCRIWGKEKYLFLEDDKWFMEGK